MIRLIGSRKFIGLPVGTLYKEFWFNNQVECEKMIDEFIKNPSKFLDTEDLMIYQDNGASLVLEDPYCDDDICLVDINVVGDADPSNTLRIVFDLDSLPEIIKIGENNEGVDMNFTKRQIKEFISIMKENDESNTVSYKTNLKWAMCELDKLYENGNRIVDIDILAVMGGII